MSKVQIIRPSTDAYPFALDSDGKAVVGEAAVARLERKIASGETSADERAQAKLNAEIARREAAKRSAAQQVPALEREQREAESDRDRAHEAFLAAVAADPTVKAFLAYRDAQKAYDRARNRTAATRAQAQGREPGSGHHRTPLLADAIAEAIGQTPSRDLHGYAARGTLTR